jgi:hypothetical protein
MRFEGGGGFTHLPFRNRNAFRYFNGTSLSEDAASSISRSLVHQSSGEIMVFDRGYSAVGHLGWTSDGLI